MSVLDKFMNVMKLGGDEYEDDYDDEYEDDYEDEKPKKSFFKRGKGDEDDLDDFPEDTVSKTRSSQRITPIHSAARKQANGMEVCVIKPTRFEDAREVTETLLSNRTVVLNFEGLDVDIAQRIIDFTSGSCFAVGGNLQKVSGYIFLVTPRNVDISGDLQDILSGSLDIPSVYGQNV